MSHILTMILYGICLAGAIGNGFTTADLLVRVAAQVREARTSEFRARRCGEDLAFAENLREAKALLNSLHIAPSDTWDAAFEGPPTQDCRFSINGDTINPGLLHTFAFLPHRERNATHDNRLPNWRPRWRHMESIQ